MKFSKSLCIGAAIGFIAMFGLIYSSEPYLGLSIIAGFIGSVIGIAVAWPVHMSNKQKARQQLVDRLEPEPIGESNSKTGMWQFRNGLIIDPDTVQFPNRCIFTNRRINELLPFTIGSVAVGDTSILKKTKIELLPVSKSWLRRRKKKGKSVQFVVLGVSILLFTVGMILYIFGNGDFSLPILMMVIASFGIMIGFSVPKLASFTDSQEVYQARFFDDGRIFIGRPHPDFIEGLPKLKVGFLHGLLGIEKLVDDIS